MFPPIKVKVLIEGLANIANGRATVWLSSSDSSSVPAVPVVLPRALHTVGSGTRPRCLAVTRRFNSTVVGHLANRSCPWIAMLFTKVYPKKKKKRTKQVCACPAPTPDVFPSRDLDRCPDWLRGRKQKISLDKQVDPNFSPHKQHILDCKRLNVNRHFYTNTWLYEGI